MPGSQCSPDRLEDGRPDAQTPPRMGSILLGLPSQAGACHHLPPPSTRSLQAHLWLRGLCTHSPLSLPALTPPGGSQGSLPQANQGARPPRPSNLRCSSPYWCWGVVLAWAGLAQGGGGSEWCLGQPGGAEQHRLTRAEPSAARSVRSPALGSARECNLSPAVQKPITSRLGQGGRGKREGWPRPSAVLPLLPQPLLPHVSIPSSYTLLLPSPTPCC